MPLEKVATAIPGCYELRPPVSADARGTFVKTFERDWFERNALRTDWAEQYYSVSRKGVLRGLHFQLPPHDHAKLVVCTAGEVLDAVVDLRVGSPTFGRHVCIALSAAHGNMAYLDPGLAHGFYTLSESATLLYNVTSAYASSHDSGIRWDSAGIAWPGSAPQLSDRDRAFAPLAEFASPFRYGSQPRRAAP
jgi:dTDP-4-dehydrorhamnose 3,5-epimerase